MGISLHTRKRLWLKSNNTCAFTGCGQELAAPTKSGDDDTIVSHECHIIARRDHPSVARSVSSLSSEEKARWRTLIEHRDNYRNLVLMCTKHSVMIDDPNGGYSVADIVEMKIAHEEAVARSRATMPAVSGAEIGLAATPVRAILLDDFPSWQRKAAAELAKADLSALAWLQRKLGVPAEPAAIANLIEAWPAELAIGPEALLNLLAREAEAVGLWAPATTVWEKSAERAGDGAQRADRLTRAAIDAGVGGYLARREELLSRAEASDPDCPRLQLEQIDESLPADEQLEALTALSTEDDALSALIAGRKALVHLMEEDLESAEQLRAEMQRLDGDKFALGMLSVNIEVQRARVAVRQDRPFILADMLAAREEALELRESLIEMGRWEESGRLLMLATDMSSLMREPGQAQALLEEARPEELETPHGRSVLGDAALRAGASSMALRLVEDGDATRDESLARIRATAQSDLSGPARREGLEELERIALGGGPESQPAAIARLIASLPPVSAGWNEAVAAALPEAEFERPVVTLRIMATAQKDLAEAKQLASDLPDEAWAAEIRLRLAGIGSDPSELSEAAANFLRFSPDAAGRLLAAMALARAEEFQRAGEIAGDVARNPNHPPAIRSDAFATLMKTIADRDGWADAERVWNEWRDFSFATMPKIDSRVSAWQVRVLHNKPRHHHSREPTRAAPYR